ncbi:transposase [Scytonema sp. HK-05]|uniref:transposase n=1 Tax=Scytonema sp. HK-05 TaxID=1137095 RepID=UPI0018E985CE|nr:transposase [Scytonema sp. HK-05]
MSRDILTDQQWEKLLLLLALQKPRTGRPNNDHHQVINGILWILRTDASWRDLAQEFGSWKTVSSRFYRWQKADIWEKIWEYLQPICGYSFRRSSK